MNMPEKFMRLNLPLITIRSDSGSNVCFGLPHESGKSKHKFTPGVTLNIIVRMYTNLIGNGNFSMIVPVVKTRDPEETDLEKVNE